MNRAESCEDKDLLRAVTAIREAAKDGRIACPEALSLAHTLGLPPFIIGRAADKAGIKIVGCQLGCFGREKGPEKKGVISRPE
ncbi:MAG TPA: hypothetical protein GX507_05510 [Clostridia bacterium]|nr:hypothetical protein [Clostridia bacterium]